MALCRVQTAHSDRSGPRAVAQDQTGPIPARRRFDASAIGRIFRGESGRSVATVMRVFGQIDVAEDAVQDAFALALRSWPRDGVPPNPGGWITTSARRCAIDRLRRNARGRELLQQLAVLDGEEWFKANELQAVADERLRLIFTCCHPALAAEAQVALTLRLLGGLSTGRGGPRVLDRRAGDGSTAGACQSEIKPARIPYRGAG
jgi:RNA polymerase sigma-70 factor, ECF subfamily